MMGANLELLRHRVLERMSAGEQAIHKVRLGQNRNTSADLVADLGDGPVRTADVADRAGYRGRASTSVLRESLLRKDLVYSPRRGLVDFTVPPFADFLRRHYPLSSLTGDD